MPPSRLSCLDSSLRTPRHLLPHHALTGAELPANVTVKVGPGGDWVADGIRAVGGENLGSVKMTGLDVVRIEE